RSWRDPNGASPISRAFLSGFAHQLQSGRSATALDFPGLFGRPMRGAPIDAQATSTARPETRYARSGDVHLAYQVFGEGELDIVLVNGFISHVELVWEHEPAVRLFEGLASFSRVITFDRRGFGLSDPVATAPTLEERMDDVRAVMDAAGSERAALLGISEGVPMSILFAATYPERAQ